MNTIFESPILLETSIDINMASVPFSPDIGQLHLGLERGCELTLNRVCMFVHLLALFY